MNPGLLKILLLFAVVLGIGPRHVFAQAANYQKTIPPEILRQYDPDIVKGTRPRIVRITQPMIWSLRGKPDQGGEVYVLDFDPPKISTVQKDIVLKWILSGKKIVLWGSADCGKFSGFFPGLANWGSVRTLSERRIQLASHPVNTDCSRLDFGGKQGMSIVTSRFAQYPPTIEVIASVKSGVVAGRAPCGRGSVYFVNCSRQYWARGTDKDRWTLNFHQWMLGLHVPGSAVTRVAAGGGGSASTKGDTKDRILLKNGDTVSGKLVTKSFTVKTSYAQLSFGVAAIESIVLEGGGQNIETIVLRNGDRLSGLIGPDSIKVKLDGGQEVVIKKDKIKEINIQRRR